MKSIYKEINSKKIAILLATYNSEIFLKQQFDSILNQTFKDFSIYIHDDGSTDDTIKIIEYYQAQFNNIKLLDDFKSSRGAADSFMWLLEKVESEYYMFCDHDDLWLPNKIEVSLRKLQEMESKYGNFTACLVHTDLIVVDDNLKTLNKSFWKQSKIKPKYLEKFNYIGVFNCATGCTMIFNKKARDKSLPFFKLAPMHDWWIAANVAKYGVIQHIETPTILYRQHGDNVVGARVIDFRYFYNKIRNINNTLSKYQDLFPFIKAIGYGSVFKFYYYKLLYTILRNI